MVQAEIAALKATVETDVVILVGEGLQRRRRERWQMSSSQRGD